MENKIPQAPGRFFHLFLQAVHKLRREFLEVLFGIENDLQEKITIDDFEGTLKSLVTVKPHLDLFFEKVMVMVEDPAIKQARLQLLGKMVRLFKEVADLSEIQVASSK